MKGVNSALLLSGAVFVAVTASFWLRVLPINARPTSTVSSTSQPVTGTPGSPSATTTINGKQLPPMPQPFGGKIERNAAQ